MQSIPTIPPPPNYDESQWRVAVERMRHFETLIMSGYGAFLLGTSYVIKDLTVDPKLPPKSADQSANDYWFAVGFLSVICFAHLHLIGRLIAVARAALVIEKRSSGSLSLISLTSVESGFIYRLGFLTISFAPLVCTLLIGWRFRSLVGSTGSLIYLAGFAFLTACFTIQILRTISRVRRDTSDVRHIIQR